MRLPRPTMAMRALVPGEGAPEVPAARRAFPPAFPLSSNTRNGDFLEGDPDEGFSNRT